jgi:trans-aconitate methyltransferase
MSHNANWPAYYQRLTDRQPRELLTRVLKLIETDLALASQRQAIDLGCGDGTETLALIEHGWCVLAIDRDPQAMRLVESKIPAEKQTRLQTQKASFEDMQLDAAHLVYAGLSLPFCSRQHFDALWHKITESIQAGGYFAGHFFGDHDTWAADPSVTCLTRSQVESLFEGFEIRHIDESENDQPTALGDPKHWHIIEVIAQKPLD